MVRPSALAVLRLMTSSNFVGCSTGRSAGFAPLRILSTKTADRRVEALEGLAEFFASGAARDRGAVAPSGF